jgi:hypothetical protein
MSLVKLLFLVTFWVAPTVVVGAEPSPARGSESLGSQLLEDLTTTTPPVTNRPQRSPKGEPRTNDKAQAPIPRFDDLGEDIGQPSGPLPLVRARNGMQRAQAMLAVPFAAIDNRALKQTSLVQEQIVAQLDELIAELSRQCQGGQCSQPSQSPSASQRSQAKSNKPANTPGRGTSAAHDSSDRLDRVGAESVEKQDVDALVKELWGHLPQRSREQMLQWYSGEFLPKYQLEIEQYYRRLSEEKSTTDRSSGP